MTHTFNAPQAVVIGAGASKELAHHIARLGASKVLFVTDPFLLQSGLIEQLRESVDQAGIQTAIFSGVHSDPTVQDVQDGLAALKASGAELIVAVGGGSPMDAAKAVSLMSTNPEPLSQYMGYHKFKRAGLPLIAIPTTAGTGSEATKVTVITDTERNVKMMMLDAHLMPTVALVDYELTRSMPPALTAHVGVDTLTHAIEAYVSRKANGMAEPIALSCIGLVAKYLLRAWSDPDDLEAREGMSLAALQGGMAFTNSSVCLVHGMSRPLGVQFHLAHGLSNAILLPAVTRFSVHGAPERYAVIARAMGLAEIQTSDNAACNLLIDGLESLNNKLEVPRLRDCRGVEQGAFETYLQKMAADALASGSPQNNPVVPTAEQIIEIYKQAW